MRTAPFLHGAGILSGPPTFVPHENDDAYIDACPPGKKPAFSRYRTELGYWGGNGLFKQGQHLLDWFLQEAAAGRTTALVSCFPDRDLGGGKAEPLDQEIVDGKWKWAFQAMAYCISAYKQAGGKHVWFTLRSECNGTWPSGTSIPGVYPTACRTVAGLLGQKLTWHVHPWGTNPWATLPSGKPALHPGDHFVEQGALSMYDAAIPGSAVWKFYDAFCAEFDKRGMNVIGGESACWKPGTAAMPVVKKGDPPGVPLCIPAWYAPRAAFIESHPNFIGDSVRNFKDWPLGQGPADSQDSRAQANPAVMAWLDQHFFSLPYVVHAGA